MMLQAKKSGKTLHRKNKMIKFAPFYSITIQGVDWI